MTLLATSVVRQRLFPALAPVLLPFTLSRLWVALFVYLAHGQRSFMAPVLGGWEGVRHWWLNPWTTYDSRWFIGIAAGGYQSIEEMAFFPLYPALLRLVGTEEIALAGWGLLISNAAFLGALTLLYRLAAEEFDDEVATLALWGVAFFPTSAYFSAVYSESLFLLLLLGSFFMARREQWMVAGGLAALAALTRNSGLVIGVALWLLHAQGTGFRWRSLRWSPLVGGAMPVAAFVLVQGAFFLVGEGAMASLGSQQRFGRVPTWPWQPLLADLQGLLLLRGIDFSDPVFTVLTGMAFAGTQLLNVGLVLLALALLVRYGRRLPLAYGFMVGAILAMHLSLSWKSPPHTLGAARFLSTTFPFALLAALAISRQIERRGGRGLWLAGSLALCALCSYLFGLKLFLG